MEKYENLAFKSFFYPPFSGIAPCVGTTGMVALGRVLIWVERCYGQRTKLLLFELIVRLSQLLYFNS